jgi:DNA helicase-2/ATP-dependent DNA helicase PcrA
MKFIADLHVHSKYSIATARNLDLENVYVWAQKKGITVVATGDFTHPAWLQEISNKLEPCGNGLFRLREDLAADCDRYVPPSCKGTVRFMLVSEISNIYKKRGKTRKNHNLVFIPNFSSAQQFHSRLDKIGNVRSDGRPILGLDARDLLEILLETNEDAYLVPAHVWTPWFSIFGSKSGFDAIEECFEDLTPHIFAVETGLSSDPPMNWRISDLDKVTLISNSDAHSPKNIGREATIFDTDLDYYQIRDAIKSGCPETLLGTIEFYPEEGKYHADGHRLCGVQMAPQETRSCDGLCPVCGKEVTRGVLYRVEELADRPVGFVPSQKNDFFSTVPLLTILSELMQKGPGTKKVVACYEEILNRLGPELYVLQRCPLADMKGIGNRLLVKAIDRIRNRKIGLSPGYDGEYGKISIFSETEREMLLGQGYLFDPPPKQAFSSLKRAKIKQAEEPATLKIANPQELNNDRSGPAVIHMDTDTEKELLKNLNRNQRKAVISNSQALMIQAGPGTGKTRTLTHKIAYLLENKKEDPAGVLALTFTNKAASEMRSRVHSLVPRLSPKPFIGTFHAFCLFILRQQKNVGRVAIADEMTRRNIFADALEIVCRQGLGVHLKPEKILKNIENAKQCLKEPDEITSVCLPSEAGETEAVYRKYQELMHIQGLMDFDDIILLMLKQFQNSETAASIPGFRHIFIDEYQDLNFGQYRLLQEIINVMPSAVSICVIGDPDQSIYGFRGSSISYFNQFSKDFPDVETIVLNRNYRSAEVILKASAQMIRQQSDHYKQTLYSGIHGIEQISVLQVNSAKAEAVAVGKIIEAMIGGTGFQFYDFQNKEENRPFDMSDLGFSDFAVLYRTRRQGDTLYEMLTGAGIPCQVASKENLLATKGITELVSLLKILDGDGTYRDLSRCGSVFEPQIDNHTAGCLKNWGYRKKYSLQKALMSAEMFPVSGLTANKQMAICDARKTLEKMEQKTRSLTIKEKINYIAENTKIGAMVNAAKNHGNGWEQIQAMANRSTETVSRFVENLTTGKDQDIYRENAEKVALMTMHASKGLEFPVVFICGCEDGLIPFRPEMWRVDERRLHSDLEEERRLFYVAMTRAKENLFLLHADKRMAFGRTAENSQSPFIADIEKRFLDMKRARVNTVAEKKTETA